MSGRLSKYLIPSHHPTSLPSYSMMYFPTEHIPEQGKQKNNLWRVSRQCDDSVLMGLVWGRMAGSSVMTDQWNNRHVWWDDVPSSIEVKTNPNPTPTNYYPVIVCLGNISDIWALIYASEVAFWREGEKKWPVWREQSRRTNRLHYFISPVALPMGKEARRKAGKGLEWWYPN